MPVSLYMDEHVPRAITVGLPRKSIDILTVQDENLHGIDDADLLDRAGQLKRLLFTRDDDLLKEATRRQRSGEKFSGLVYAHQLKVPIGTCVHDLELICLACEFEDVQNCVTYLPF